MSQDYWSESFKKLIDQRFNELARAASLVDEVSSLREKQAEIEAGLKRDLSPEAFRSILEWEDIVNYRNTVEREWLYLAGVKDGVRLYKHLLDIMGGAEIPPRQS
ncbi:hypothetical protein [Paenibacillus sp. FSL R7-0273]|uniref:hypothetical protein n=1 Tax=Paenibacillus sp. FSL R7-0273 TaxID=1536772 RepID=UPI00063ED9AB|nr:hypothetical protein [Paenibacillus sp. FSL R7-0273]OMF95262.1 hypothetical protein BK144_06955 [Paenibacillus sp. FSL R7-0273]